jgi:hypothetical protein
MEDPELGDYGMAPEPIKNPPNTEKKKKQKNWIRKLKTKKAARKQRVHAVKNLSNIMADLNL